MASREGEARSRFSVCPLLFALAAALPAAACSFSIGAVGPDTSDQTGSTAPTFRSPLSPALDTEDWRRARAAMAVAIDPQGNGSSVGWDNPDSGVKGSFVSVGAPFVQSDHVCRSFVATLGGVVPDQSLQGTACRTSPDEWDVFGVKPWRKPT